jgi:hypothetical protein
MPLTEEEIAAKEAELAEREKALEAARGDGEGDLDNSAWKSHPNTTKLTQRISELQKAEDERKAAEEQAKKNAEIEAAKAKEDWKEAERLKDEQHQREIDALKAKTTKSELKAELAAKGFDADALDFLVYKYDAETHPEIGDYVTAAFEDESNKKFMATHTGREPKTPPGPTPSGGSNLSGAQLREMRNSDKPEERAAAQSYLEDYFDKTGKLPEGYKGG